MEAELAREIAKEIVKSVMHRRDSKGTGEPQPVTRSNARAFFSNHRSDLLRAWPHLARCVVNADETGAENKSQATGGRERGRLW